MIFQRALRSVQLPMRFGNHNQEDNVVENDDVLVNDSPCNLNMNIDQWINRLIVECTKCSNVRRLNDNVCSFKHA